MKIPTINDPLLSCSVIAQTPNPNFTVLMARKQDYSAEFVGTRLREDSDMPLLVDCKTAQTYTHESAGLENVEKLLAGGRGHLGPFEHPSLTLNLGYYPHSVINHLRTHRLLSFDCQSFRYTGTHIFKLGEALHSNKLEFDAAIANANRIFYVRPPGTYTGRYGTKFIETEDSYRNELALALESARHYYLRVSDGCAMEQARGSLPFDFRQHFVISGNARSWLHLFDVRIKPDVQLEAQHAVYQCWLKFKSWMPELAEWYESKRLMKALLGP
jgi:thymidylate synthase (FAD)